MFELLTMFLTGGGSAALGSILKGVFGTIADNRQQKFELELAREARGNEFALKFQQQLNNGPGGAFTRATRRLLALILIGTLSAVVILCTLYPSAEIITLSNASGEGKTEFLFGLLSFPAKQSPIMVTTGHLSAYFVVILCPMVVGFYYTPGGRK
jgi:hypothetical protein|tara:strand:+ start:86 stop:550 length:465 start_codon:yes stop_codon:yes gene_type:complete